MPGKHTFTLYLDESGDELLHREEEYVASDSIESHCTLMGTILPNNKKDLLARRFRELKERIWGDREVILHSVKIRARKGAFVVFLYKPELYESFKEEMNAILSEVEPTIICVSLDKRRWVKVYPRKLEFGDDPYAQAFVYLVERYATLLNQQEGEVTGRIVVEQRTPEKDLALQRTYNATRLGGTQYKSKSHFRKLAPNLEFKTKAMNIAGLQLSDYCCYPFYINHRYPERDNGLYEHLKQFIFTGSNGHKKWP